MCYHLLHMVIGRADTVAGATNGKTYSHKTKRKASCQGSKEHGSSGKITLT